MQAATLARGRKIRQAKLLFYAKLAEKALQSYERDGWGEFPTQIIPERREIRPTADRGPILLCVDTSGRLCLFRLCVQPQLCASCMMMWDVPGDGGASVRGAQRTTPQAFCRHRLMSLGGAVVCSAWSGRQDKMGHGLDMVPLPLSPGSKGSIYLVWVAGSVNKV